MKITDCFSIRMDVRYEPVLLLNASTEWQMVERSLDIEVSRESVE